MTHDSRSGIQGLGTVIYPVSDIARARQWYAAAFVQEPYFDQPFYVGFNIGGYELGLDPNASHKPSADGGIAYWRVRDIGAVLQHFTEQGATVIAPVQDVGGDIKVATVGDPFGNAIGLVQNPHFSLPSD
jgi:predicted enzyme related to lactoylglutathione lyase